VELSVVEQRYHAVLEVLQARLPGRPHALGIVSSPQERTLGRRRPRTAKSEFYLNDAKV
jgi:hypothetical protein